MVKAAFYIRGDKMMGSFKEKRAYERIPASIAVRFSCDNLSYSVYYGTVDNISKNGMLIRTGSCFSSNTNIRLFIYKEKILLVNAKVRRLIKTEGFYQAMGVEVVGPDEEYLEFIDSLR